MRSYRELLRKVKKKNIYIYILIGILLIKYFYDDWKKREKDKSNNRYARQIADVLLKDFDKIINPAISFNLFDVGNLYNMAYSADYIFVEVVKIYNSEAKHGDLIEKLNQVLNSKISLFMTKEEKEYIKLIVERYYKLI